MFSLDVDDNAQIRKRSNLGKKADPYLTGNLETPMNNSISNKRNGSIDSTGKADKQKNK